MDYNFETCRDRSRMGSEKWDNMRAANPDVPKGIIPFSVADMELDNPPEIIEGLKEYVDNMVFGYTGPTESYFDSVISWMRRRHGLEVKKEWLVQTPGVVTGLYYVVQSMTKAGDGIIIMPPVYYPFPMVINANKRTVVESPLRLSGKRYEIDFEDLEQKASRPENTMLIFCSPHNPVGRVWDREELHKVADICIRHNVILVCDEIHNDLILPGFRHTMMSLAHEEIGKQLVICTSPSKTFNLAGLQVSNLIVENKELRERLAGVLTDSFHMGLNVFAYEACRLGYDKCEGWLSGLLSLLDKNRLLTEAFMKSEIPDIEVFPLEGTYLQWWDCRKLGLSEKELEYFMQKEALLFMDEGYLFGKQGSGFERINLACPTFVLEEALVRLKEACRKRGL